MFRSISFTLVPHPKPPHVTLSVYVSGWNDDLTEIVTTDIWEIDNDFSRSDVQQSEVRTWMNSVARAIARNMEDDFEFNTRLGNEMAPRSTSATRHMRS